jgi:hypothetical protein
MPDGKQARPAAQRPQASQQLDALSAAQRSGAARPESASVEQKSAGAQEAADAAPSEPRRSASPMKAARRRLAELRQASRQLELRELPTVSALAWQQDAVLLAALQPQASRRVSLSQQQLWQPYRLPRRLQRQLAPENACALIPHDRDPENSSAFSFP